MRAHMVRPGHASDALENDGALGRARANRAEESSFMKQKVSTRRFRITKRFSETTSSRLVVAAGRFEEGLECLVESILVDFNLVDY